jgi:XTP/dITP diphosphohydrolase
MTGGVASLVVATTNRDKIREILALLAGTAVAIRTLADYQPVAEPEETGATFEENAVLKATAYARALASCLGADSIVVAEDSGLVVDALDGAPGVHSARFLGPDATYPARFAEIARRLAQRREAPRTARFVCALAAVDREGTLRFATRGVVEGLVAESPAGAGGFGYDPIFFYPPYGRTLAEVTDDEKRAVAHRGQAFRAFVEWLGQPEAGSREPRSPPDSPTS